MNNKKKLFEQDENKVPSNRPLSNEELGRVIKASKDKSFKSIEIKKEKEEGFKKVSLHDIAKQAKDTNKKIEENEEQNSLKNDEVDSKKEEIKDDNHNDEIKNNNIEINKAQASNSDLKEDVQLNKEDEKKDNPEENINQKQESKIDKSLHLEEIEKQKKIAFEEGRNKAFSEIQEGSEAAIGILKKISENLTNVDKEDLKKLEEQITEKIIEFSSDLSGTIIKALPSDFTKRIKSYISSLENIEGDSKVFINENDYKILEKNKEVKKEIKNLNIFPSPEFRRGEFQIKVNGVSISKKMIPNK